jgi:hypothetical protein
MAQKVTVALEDDLTGGPAEETVRFAVDGTGYEIDLSATNARAFSKLLAPISSTRARPGGRRAAGPGGPRPAGSARVISGPGRKSMAWRSVSAAASRPAWPSSITPRAAGADTPRRCHARQASHRPVRGYERASGRRQRAVGLAGVAGVVCPGID